MKLKLDPYHSDGYYYLYIPPSEKFHLTVNGKLNTFGFDANIYIKKLENY
jgi:hypothetical protein